MKTTTAIIVFLGLLLCHDAFGFAPSASFSVKPTSSSSALLDKNSFSVPDIDLSAITDSLSRFDAEQVVANIKGDGDPLGSRGEYYTAAQAVLIVCILVGGVPYAGPIFQFM